MMITWKLVLIRQAKPLVNAYWTATMIVHVKLFVSQLSSQSILNVLVRSVSKKPRSNNFTI